MTAGTVAIVDTSCLVALAFGESGAASIRARLRRHRLFASALVEAELASAFAREEVEADVREFIAPISLVMPDRPLLSEIQRALHAGYLRGAELWHVACALYLSPMPSDVAFLTLDQEQRRVARRLGFVV